MNAPPYRAGGPPVAFTGPGYTTGVPTGNRNLTPGGYGTQAITSWAAGDTSEKEIAQAMAAEYLWRVSVSGDNLLLDLTYGTGSTARLLGLRLPFVAYIPGQFSLVARKDNPAAVAVARPTITAASGGASVLRQQVTGAAALDARAARVTALTGGAALTINGIAFAFAAVGQAVDVVAPSAVTAGSVLVELTL